MAARSAEEYLCSAQEGNLIKTLRRTTGGGGDGENENETRNRGRTFWGDKLSHEWYSAFFFSFFFRQVDVTGDLYEREYLKETKRKCMENCDTTCSESKKYWHA